MICLRISTTILNDIDSSETGVLPYLLRIIWKSTESTRLTQHLGFMLVSPLLKLLARVKAAAY